jgi:hypothetical protein
MSVEVRSSRRSVVNGVKLQESSWSPRLEESLRRISKLTRIHPNAVLCYERGQPDTALTTLGEKYSSNDSNSDRKRLFRMIIPVPHMHNGDFITVNKPHLRQPGKNWRSGCYLARWYVISTNPCVKKTRSAERDPGAALLPFKRAPSAITPTSAKTHHLASRPYQKAYHTCNSISKNVLVERYDADRR